MDVTLKNFFIPNALRLPLKVHKPAACAVVPTYKPSETVLTLVQDLLTYNPDLRVVVVDDSTPLDHPSMVIIERLRALSPRIELLRTPENRLKAGALNMACAHVMSKGPQAPAAILTLDDDVRIAPDTVTLMLQSLLANSRLGAVCSRASVANKNKNVLTRLQGLEYVGFNAIRFGDEGFVRGPLVMHGMMTAFRVRALRQVGPFAQKHLIEDYEMTTRLKEHGWEVKAVVDARASTHVPETLKALWRQRTRWSYGGLLVLLQARDRSVVIQDVLGHAVFLLTLTTIGLLWAFQGSGSVPPAVVSIILALSLVQLALWYGLQLWLMRWYPEKDGWDWALRLSLLPELLYSNLMTVALVGSYLYLILTLCAKSSWTGLARLARAGVGTFARLGYSGAWGTRSL